jgi:predicted amidohydrolase
MHNVRIATMYLTPTAGKPANKLKAGLDYADLAGQDKADIFCLPEFFGVFEHIKGRWDKYAETVPGPTTDALARKARKHSMYVVCPLLEKRDGKLYNSAVLLDRKGKVAGIYCKHVPTIGELENGVVPGTEVKAFKTDFGKVGMAICFDLNFHDLKEKWRQQAPDIIFWPSAFEGGAPLQGWAQYCQAYVVSSTYGENARILDKNGDTLALARWQRPFVAATVNLDRAAYHWDYTQVKVPRIKRKYGADVSVENMTPEGWIFITSEKRGLTLRQLEREFRLERTMDYLLRARAMRDQAAHG